MSFMQYLSLSDANQALQDIAEGVEELEAECYRLRAELKTSNAERNALRQQVENIKNGFEGSCYACEPVGEMNKKLLKERDSARRLFCEWSAGSDRPGEAKEDIACDNGWSDLYEKKTP